MHTCCVCVLIYETLLKRSARKSKDKEGAAYYAHHTSRDGSDKHTTRNVAPIRQNLSQHKDTTITVDALRFKAVRIYTSLKAYQPTSLVRGEFNFNLLNHRRDGR